MAGQLRILLFSGDEFRPMESDSVAEFEPVSSTLRLALSAISAKNKENYHLKNSYIQAISINMQTKTIKTNY